MIELSPERFNEMEKRSLNAWKNEAAKLLRDRTAENMNRLEEIFSYAVTNTFLQGEDWREWQGLVMMIEERVMRRASL